MGALAPLWHDDDKGAVRRSGCVAVNGWGFITCACVSADPR